MLSLLQSQRTAISFLSFGLLLPLISLTACEKKAVEHSAPKGEAPKPGDTPSPKKEAQASVKQDVTAKNVPPRATAELSAFRSVDPFVDGFSLAPKTKWAGLSGMARNGNWVISGEVGSITATESSGGLEERVAIELELVSGTVTESRVETKDFGIIMILLAPGKSTMEFRMTEESIAKVRAALRAKKKK